MTPKPPIPKLQSLSSETVIPEELKVELEHQPYRGTFQQEPLAGKASESCSKSLWNEALRGEGRLAAQAAILHSRIYSLYNTHSSPETQSCRQLES